MARAREARPPKTMPGLPGSFPVPCAGRVAFTKQSARVDAKKEKKRKKKKLATAGDAYVQ